jgi:putative ABC transport system permease protein
VSAPAGFDGRARRLGMRLRIYLHLAHHNVRRNARRSALTAAAMALGLAVLAWTKTIGDGAHETWVDSGVRMGTGHVAIQAPGFQRSGRLADRLDSARLAAATAALTDPRVAPDVRAVAPRLAVSGLASSPSAALPVQIRGVDPADEAVFSDLGKSLVAGGFVGADDRLGAVIGVALARRLELGIGSRFVLTAQTAGGDIAGQLVRVAGTFRTGVSALDEGLVYLPIGTARSWLGAPGASTTLAVLLRSSRATDRVVRVVRERLGAGTAVLSWREAAPELDSAVRIDDWGGYVFLAILLVIVALAILNAVLMSVLNRNREFGVLQALGLTKRETGLVVFTEGLLLSAVSGVIGTAIGFGVTWVLWRDGLDLSALMKNDITLSGTLVSPVLVPEFRWSQLIICLAAVLAIGVAASLYPARQAARIDVAEAMKFER